MPIRSEAALGPLERPSASRMEVQALADKKKLTEEVEEASDEMIMILMPRFAWEQACALARRCNISTGEILGFALKHLQEDLNKE